MKRIFTLVAIAITALTSNSQVVFNEVYTDPGSGNSEFFEFYNSSSSLLPESIDNYTVVTYYEEGSKSGFYVMDMPNHFIGPRSYYVGSSSSVFNCQGRSNLVASFSWNILPSGAAVAKWEKSGSGYVSVAIPANFNDFFVKRTGSGAGQHIFVFKNGILMNALIGGATTSIVPTYIKSMPSLFVDMMGTSPDFTINFSALQNNQLEYVGSATGSDNGYLRVRDGLCGTWDKSSSQAQHTPGLTNGSATGVDGSLDVTSYISYGVAPADPSVLNYSVTAGPVDAFPVIIEAYRDFGIAGQLDAADILFHSRTITSASATVYTTNLVDKRDKVMLIAKSPAGCYDQVVALTNGGGTLPVKLNNFQGSKNKSNVQLQWNVSINEIANSFEVERSTDGKNFGTAVVMFGSEKTGNETYNYNELNDDSKVYYRLRMTDKSDVVTYSKILVFNNNASNGKPLNIIGNVTNDRLTFGYEAVANSKVEVRVLDMNGRVMVKQTLNANKGNNLASISLPSAMTSGMYIATLTAENLNSSAKFVKQ